MQLFRHTYLAFFLLVLGTVTSVARAETASDHAASFQAGLLETMKVAESLDVKGRYQKLQPVVEKAFHLQLMAGLSAGQFWQTASDDQRKRLVKAFTRMSIATLATLFDGYSGQTFKVSGERDCPHGVVFVDTLLQRHEDPDDDVKISYGARKVHQE